MSSILLIPFLAWFIGGSTKFVVNSIKSKKLAFGKVGYGGWPSNHATIVSSTASYLIFKYPDSPQYSLVAITLSFIVCMDAMGLRKHMQRQAKVLKELANKNDIDSDHIRTTLAHKPTEVLAGIVLGAIIGYFTSTFNF